MRWRLRRDRNAWDSTSWCSRGAELSMKGAIAVLLENGPAIQAHAVGQSARYQVI
jgi:hypothetical protein